MRVTFLAICMLFAQFATAGTVANLYRAEVAVPSDQQGAPLQSQLQTALTSVLVKVSGQSNLASNTLINQQLATAGNMMQTFRYSPPENSLSSNTNGTLLVVDFSRQAVDNLIKQAGFKPLGEQRPTVLVWAVSNRNIVGQSATSQTSPLDSEQIFVTQDSKLGQQLIEQAKSRGLPLQFPLFDLTDQTALQVSDVWGLFPQAIKLASARYRPDAVIAVRFNQSPSGIMTMDWLYIDGEEPVRLAASGMSSEMTSELIAYAADTQFKPVVYQRLEEFQSGVAIHIDNVRSFADYNSAVTFLKGLPVISNVKPERVQSDRMTIRVELAGNSAQLIDAISLEPRLKPLDLSQTNKKVHYYWQP